MSQVDRILETIDHGEGRPAAGIVYPMNQAACARQGCGRRPEVSHDFCSPCLAWLRFESDDDPLGDRLPDESVGPEVPPTRVSVEVVSHAEHDWACGI